MVRKEKHREPEITKRTSRSQAAKRGWRDNSEKREAEQGVERDPIVKTIPLLF